MEERLVLGLYGEGTTDYHFLPGVIAKTTQRLLGCQQNYIKIEMFDHVPVETRKNKNKILYVANQAYTCHALIIHADADASTADNAKTNRFDKGYELVQKCTEKTCKHLIPVIPVQAIEAWLLADHETLLDIIGTRKRPEDLGIPKKAKAVEAIAKPKERLKEAVHKAFADRSKRHRDSDISFIYGLMGERIALRRLDQLPSYQQFVRDLTITLQTLNLIQ